MADIIQFPVQPATPQTRIAAATARLQRALERQSLAIAHWRIANATLEVSAPEPN